MSLSGNSGAFVSSSWSNFSLVLFDTIKGMFNGIVDFTYPEGEKQGQTTAALKIATQHNDYTTLTTYINYRE